jgi:hypothetical protein
MSVKMDGRSLLVMAETRRFRHGSSVALYASAYERWCASRLDPSGDPTGASADLYSALFAMRRATGDEWGCEPHPDGETRDSFLELLSAEVMALERRILAHVAAVQQGARGP